MLALQCFRKALPPVYPLLPAMPQHDLEKTIALVSYAQKGDTHALETLFSRYFPIVVRIAELRIGRRLRGNLEAEDIAQEALAEAFKNLASFEFRSEGSFKNWLARIVESRIADEARKNMAVKRGAGKVRRQTDLSKSTIGPQVMGVNSETPSMLARANELESRIEAALMSQLSERHREIIILRKLCCMDYPEILVAMDIAREGTARALHARAMKSLQSAINF